MYTFDSLPARTLAEFADAIGKSMPLVVSRIPAGPAEELGRIGLAAKISDLLAPIIPDEPRDSRAVRAIGHPLLDRILEALEPTVRELDVTAPSEITSMLTPQGGMYGVTSFGGESNASLGLKRLEGRRPGAFDLLEACVRALLRHPGIAELCTVVATGEEEITARHGAAYLALTTTASTALFRGLPMADSIITPAIIGAAAAAAALILSEVPAPKRYSAAAPEKRHTEYLYPRQASGHVLVRDYRFALTEGSFPTDIDIDDTAFARNGLVVAVPGGVVIRTGGTDCGILVRLHVFAGPPPKVDLELWEEIVDISWTAATRSAVVLGPAENFPDHGLDKTPSTTLPSPGDYRLRVHAYGRDGDGDDQEFYKLVLWAAPAEPEVVHQTLDRLGHRLRGEPEPPAAPEAEHRWVENSSVYEAATFTLVTGLTAHEVLEAFGADPTAPVPIDTLTEQWVAVLETGSVVLAVEDNGFRGSTEAVLRRLSRKGKAASMFWNVDAMSYLGLAENGRILAYFEPGDPEGQTNPELAEVFDGLDFTHRIEAKGLTAIARFVGHTITEDDLTRTFAPGVGYRIAKD
ncbi:MULTISPECIES: DUF6461 domain-containing protein [unclassified Nocardia]|uniref:DUF6461 domain-containing protein n=1 Tax=unclassified Nocardia TaxID=2637762 RepID=UPI001CE41C50|nr:MULTISPECIES: DUF6461 domain-containing protein [unclassified Nocardia]